MSEASYTTAFTVKQTPPEVFAAINNVRGWWSKNIDGTTDQLDSIFHYHFQDLHRCKIQITELIPDKKVVWHVLDNYFSFTKDKAEWTGTDIIFEITKVGDQTELRFTHRGLVPSYECYPACQDGWNTYINTSLKNLIETGTGAPNAGDAVTDTEKSLT